MIGFKDMSSHLTKSIKATAPSASKTRHPGTGTHGDSDSAQESEDADDEQVPSLSPRLVKRCLVAWRMMILA